MKRKVTFKVNNIAPICIPRDEADAQTLDGGRYIVMGWGAYLEHCEY